MGAIGHKDNSGEFHFYNGVSNPDGLQMDLLWENSSPTSGFAAQTITVPNYKSYDALLIKFRTDTNLYFWQIIPSDEDTRIFYASSNHNVGIRNIYIKEETGDNMQFSTGFWGSSPNTNDNVPILIYGINW